MSGKNSTAAAAAAAALQHPSRQSPLLCRFYFHSGNCRNDDACRFSHDANGLTREEALQTIPCPYFARGACRYGEHCELKHEELQESSGDGDDDDAAVCGICLENPSSSRRKYGILSCCNHPFCFTCLMEWRTEGSDDVTSRRVCPTCRKQSDYVVPSSTMPASDAEKVAVVESYRARLAGIPCKHFDGEPGSCPFGRDCFYAHQDDKGRDVKARDKSMQELYEERQRHRNRDRAGDIEHITEMLLMMGMQRHLEREGGGSGRGGRRGRRGSRVNEHDSEEEDMDRFLSPYIDFIASLVASDGDDDFVSSLDR